MKWMAFVLAVLLGWNSLALGETNPDRPNRIAIHFVTLENTKTLPVRMTQDHFNAHMVVEGPPILTEVDILEYCWSEHKTRLSNEGITRWRQLGEFKVHPGGVPLAVVVDGVPCYGGLLWNSLSSASSRVPRFHALVNAEGYVRIWAGAIYENEEPTPDARNSAEVRTALKDLGLLRDSCE